ncbi:hypothetical protein GCM10009119_16050 [Algoriphagus jejuensis]|uniref:Toxin-antitoxin system antitoxin component (TIGR02293 family) n=1 Tax=Algoriphagus jejuensis TaxID=419934 RepID=A0ABP3YCL8_9BACT
MILETEDYQTSAHYKKLVQILGKRAMQWQIRNSFDFIAIATDGVDAQIIENFWTHFELSKAETSKLLNISEPTIYRWTKSGKKLDRNYSIQIFELTDLFLYGQEVFESQHNFFQWLEMPNMALGGFEPREILEIPGGLSKVRDLLGRIDHGVFS